MFLFLVLFFSNDLTAVTYYVKTNGSDLSLGTTWTGAFRTIQHAADIMSSGDTAFVSNGRYSEEIDITNKNSINFTGYGDDVKISGDWQTNLAFKVEGSQNIRIENFHIFSNNTGMIFLTNSDNCTVSNIRIYDNNFNRDLGFAIKLIDCDNNRIVGNTIYHIESISNTRTCFGVYLFHSHNNVILSNEIKESGSGALYGGIDIWFHGIYLLNSDNNYLRYNLLHDMDHNGIHIIADNTKGAPFTFLDNKILDNTINGIDRAITTREVQLNISDSFTGQIIGRNRIWNTAKGIEWDANSTTSAGNGGLCFKNSISTANSNNNYLEGVVLIDWSRINFSYNSIRGYYNGLSFHNYDYSLKNNVMGSNYNLNILRTVGGGPSQSIQYSCTQLGQVGSGVSSGTGNVGGDSLFDTKSSNLRLQWNSPGIGAG
ncbi:MAG: right-handed parallel beta-helix repeat-containing protein, partial [Spirochaetes bacterium]|nr:right-handed parallel beta-helix repeat-containing protein [Spirochaetota bacterium]